ncbi:hypothetical protein BSKO_10638 [Bryopsis sp. KO-2023]|nr:hypothetical protein BSKO_10638 [Bryopsis sp. KO-2023]
MSGENVNLAEVVNELEARLESSPEEKTTALQAIRSAVDPKDEAYDSQRLMVSEGVVDLLVRLLEDADSGVVCEAALTLAALTANSQSVMIRLKDLGFGERVEQLSFNPVQASLEEAQGIRKLVDLLYSESASVQEAAQEALMSASSYNHDVKLSYLSCLVSDLRNDNKASLRRLDWLVSGMEIRDDAAVVLDQAILPLLKVLEDESVNLDAVTLLGTIAEERPAAGAFLCDEGALPPIAQMIISGEARLRDAGVHALWQIIKKNKKVLQPGREMLGVEGTALVQPLLDIIQSAGVESDTDDKGFDNSDEALLILKALAEQDPSVRESVKELDLEPSRCTLM